MVPRLLGSPDHSSLSTQTIFNILYCCCFCCYCAGCLEGMETSGICLLSHHPVLILLPLSVILCISTVSTRRSSIIKTHSDGVRNSMQHQIQRKPWPGIVQKHPESDDFIHPSVVIVSLKCTLLMCGCRFVILSGKREDKQRLKQRQNRNRVTPLQCSTRLGLMGADSCIMHKSVSKTASRRT